jgi:hypothetical protein
MSFKNHVLYLIHLSYDAFFQNAFVHSLNVQFVSSGHRSISNSSVYIAELEALNASLFRWSIHSSSHTFPRSKQIAKKLELYYSATYNTYLCGFYKSFIICKAENLE